jgi:hypothetical protein
VEDEIGGFIGNVNSQVDYVCQTVKADPNLKNGFNAVGFSQGMVRLFFTRLIFTKVVNFYVPTWKGVTIHPCTISLRWEVNTKEWRISPGVLP